MSDPTSSEGAAKCFDCEGWFYDELDLKSIKVNQSCVHCTIRLAEQITKRNSLAARMKDAFNSMTL